MEVISTALIQGFFFFVCLSLNLFPPLEMEEQKGCVQRQKQTHDVLYLTLTGILVFRKGLNQ